MRAALLLLLPALLGAQPAPPASAADPGPAELQPLKDLGQGWRQPGLDLRGRRLQVGEGPAPRWTQGPPRGQDELLASRLGPGLPASLSRGLARGLKGRATVGRDAGDFRVEGSLLDAAGGSGDPHDFRQAVAGTVELRVVAAAGGAVVAAFRETLRAQDADFLALRITTWAEEVGRYLAAAPVAPAPAVPRPTPAVAVPAAAQSAPVAAPATPSPSPAAAPSPAAPKAAPAPARTLDLPAVLAAIDTLQREGLVTEAEAEALRRKARGR